MVRMTGNGQTLRQMIKQHPPGEQLELAIYMLEELTGGIDEVLAWWRTTYKLTVAEAKIAAILNARAPRAVSKEALLLALNTDAEIKIVDVFVCKLRKKVPFKIETIWGQGYVMRAPVELPADLGTFNFTRAQRGHRWTEESDQDLRLMFENGSDISVIAEELERTERAVLERIRDLGLRGAQTGTYVPTIPATI